MDKHIRQVYEILFDNLDLEKMLLSYFRYGETPIELKDKDLDIEGELIKRKEW